MFSAKTGSVISFRLEKGEEVHPSLIRALEEHGAAGGFICSGIGMLEHPEIGYFVAKGQYERNRVEGCYELLNLSGNVSTYGEEKMAHLHVMLAHEDYSVFGGHLFTAKVGLTLEGFIQITDPARLSRELEEDTGLPGLYIK